MYSITSLFGSRVYRLKTYIYHYQVYTISYSNLNDNLLLCRFGAVSSLEISTEFLPVMCWCVERIVRSDPLYWCAGVLVCCCGVHVSFFFESTVMMEQKKAKKWSVQWMFFQKHRPEIHVI